MFGISKVDFSFKAWSLVALVSEMQFVTLEFLGSVVEPLQSRRVHGYFPPPSPLHAPHEVRPW